MSHVKITLDGGKSYRCDRVSGIQNPEETDRVKKFASDFAFDHFSAVSAPIRSPVLFKPVNRDTISVSAAYGKYDIDIQSVGSVSGPRFLPCILTLSLITLISSPSLNHRLYADDTRLFLSFRSPDFHFHSCVKMFDVKYVTCGGSLVSYGTNVRQIAGTFVLYRAMHVVLARYCYRS